MTIVAGRRAKTARSRRSRWTSRAAPSSSRSTPTRLPTSSYHRMRSVTGANSDRRGPADRHRYLPGERRHVDRLAAWRLRSSAASASRVARRLRGSPTPREPGGRGPQGSTVNGTRRSRLTGIRIRRSRTCCGHGHDPALSAGSSALGLDPLRGGNLQGGEKELAQCYGNSIMAGGTSPTTGSSRFRGASSASTTRRPPAPPSARHRTSRARATWRSVAAPAATGTTPARTTRLNGTGVPGRLESAVDSWGPSAVGGRAVRPAERDDLRQQLLGPPRNGVQQNPGPARPGGGERCFAPAAERTARRSGRDRLNAAIRSRGTNQSGAGSASAYHQPAAGRARQRRPGEAAGRLVRQLAIRSSVSWVSTPGMRTLRSSGFFASSREKSSRPSGRAPNRTREDPSLERRLARRRRVPRSRPRIAADAAIVADNEDLARLDGVAANGLANEVADRQVGLVVQELHGEPAADDDLAARSTYGPASQAGTLQPLM